MGGEVCGTDPVFWGKSQPGVRLLDALAVDTAAFFSVGDLFDQLVEPAVSFDEREAVIETPGRGAYPAKLSARSDRETAMRFVFFLASFSPLQVPGGRE